MGLLQCLRSCSKRVDGLRRNRRGRLEASIRTGRFRTRRRGGRRAHGVRTRGIRWERPGAGLSRGSELPAGGGGGRGGQGRPAGLGKGRRGGRGGSRKTGGGG